MNENKSILDKNTIIGFILIFAVMFGFSYLNKPSEEQLEAQRRQADSIAQVQRDREQVEQQARELQEASENVSIDNETGEVYTNQDSVRYQRLKSTYGDFALSVEGEESFITLENDNIILTLSNKGGRVYSVRLKDYNDYKDFEAGKDTPICLFDGDEADFGLSFYLFDAKTITTNQLYFETIQDSDKSARMRLKTDDGDGYIDFIYTLHDDDYLVDFSILPHNMENIFAPATQNLTINWNQKVRQQEKGRSFEERYAYLMYKLLNDDVEKLSEGKNDKKDESSKIKWIGYKDQFFSSVLIAENSFDVTKLTSVKYEDKNDPYLKEYNTISNLAYNPKATASINFTYFFGPNKYSMLKGYDKDKFEGQDLKLEKLVPMGWSWLRPINKYIVIPIFDWLISFGMNLGIAIFILTLIIKLGLFPLVYKSFMSSAKMRVLKPQIEVINEKFPGQEQAMQRQQQTMALYKQAGVNPMAGCLPLLLQMPFLIALFWFFPSAIELRHQSFLWVPDLSTYDAIISWDANIPFISWALGNHISLFCLLFTIINIVFQKFNMEATGGGQQQMPGMKMMMYLMPVMMFFFLNSYPSGLNYYYLISTLITVLQTIIFRMVVNEDKVLAKLEANKKKSAKNPKKKSGFMARLEEAQRQQQARLKEQQKKNNRR